MSNRPQTYGPTSEGTMAPTDGDDWVHLEDYQGLEMELNRSRELYNLERAESEYYRTELAKAHELLGRVMHQLSERWDTVHLTKFYPTDNLHNKRNILNPTGAKE